MRSAIADCPIPSALRNLIKEKSSGVVITDLSC
jgi:hypothetical protein